MKNKEGSVRSYLKWKCSPFQTYSLCLNNFSHNFVRKQINEKKFSALKILIELVNKLYSMLLLFLAKASQYTYKLENCFNMPYQSSKLKNAK